MHIIKEITENTCEWTKVQQADLKVSEGEGDEVAAVSNPVFALVADLGFA